MRALRHLKISGFKSIADLDLRMGAITLLIGPNGAGKSNFIDFFRMLGELADRRLGVYVQKAGQAGALLHYGPKTTSLIEAKLYFRPVGGYHNGYAFTLAPTDDGRLFFADEVMHYRSETHGTVSNWSLGKGHSESLLSAEYEERPRNSVASYVYTSIQSWKVYHFHDTSATAAVKQQHDVHDNRELRSDAGNLAAFLYRLRETHPVNYRLIEASVRRVFPRFGAFALEPDLLAEQRIRLEWREPDSDYRFGPDQLSDGTLRFICLATLLLQPELPTTLLVDEPELGLHPSALAILAGLVRSASTRGQVVLTTQSVTFLDEFEAQDVVVVERGQAPDAHPERVPSTFRRLSSADLADWMEGYTVGELWEANELGGRP